MASPGGAVQLRPLGVGETLDAGLKLFRSRPRDMVLAALVPTVPAVIFFVLVQLSAADPQQLVRTDATTGGETVDGGAFALFLGATVVNMAVMLIASSLASAATMRVSIGVYLAEETTWRESLRFAASRWRRLTALVTLVFLATLCGLLACFVPYLWLTGIWAVAVPALLVEDLGAIRALGRSRQLVRGRFWPVLGAVLLAALLASVLQGVLTGPVLVMQLVEVDFLLTTVLNAIALLVGSALTLPFTAAVTAVIYVDLRVRKEGYDLELMARGVGVAPPEPDLAAPPPPPPGPVAPAGGWGQPFPGG